MFDGNGNPAYKAPSGYLKRGYNEGRLVARVATGDRFFHRQLRRVHRPEQWRAATVDQRQLEQPWSE